MQTSTGETSGLLKPITTVRRIIPIISSSIAAESIVVPTFPFRCPISLRACTVILTDVAKQQADQLIKNAEADARQSLAALEQQITIKQRELEETQKQFDVYKAKMESLLISQLELIKDINKDQD